MLDGPLADLDEASRDALTERTLDMVAKGHSTV
jgi:ABC-type nitrate/sulfonate/bicarbonate transport system ATPase subunit